jgi:hypothetical protein
MPATGPDLNDVVSIALAKWQPRAFQGHGAIFGAAGAPGLDGDRELMAHIGWHGARAPVAFSPDRFERLFGTKVGQRAANAVGNEGRTLAALERVSMEIMAASLRMTAQAGKTERLLVMAGEQARPPVLMVMSSQVASAKDTRLISDQLDFSLPLLEKGLHEVDWPEEPAPEAVALAEVAAGGREGLAELFLIAQPEVVLTRQPRMIPLSAVRPATPIECQGNFSTVGVLCRDADGEVGVTGAYHGIGPAGTWVLVAGREARVKRADAVQDIVFIPVDPQSEILARAGSGGVQKGREPSRSDEVHFDGVVNRNRTTRILSADAGLLRPRPTVQLRLQTAPDTDQGDSGCALLDREEDQVLGFAFERTALDDYPQFTDWIWAANAMSALQLTPYGA